VWGRPGNRSLYHDCVGGTVASKEEKRRRAALVQAMVAEDTAKAIEEMPISLAHLGQLFDHLDVELENGCDHTPRITTAFLTSNGLNPEIILPWLHDQGGFCDCEILANVEESWESEISKNT
jgi:hypothetical protein